MLLSDASVCVSLIELILQNFNSFIHSIHFAPSEIIKCNWESFDQIPEYFYSYNIEKKKAR